MLNQIDKNFCHHRAYILVEAGGKWTINTNGRLVLTLWSSEPVQPLCPCIFCCAWSQRSALVHLCTGWGMLYHGSWHNLDVQSKSDEFNGIKVSIILSQHLFALVNLILLISKAVLICSWKEVTKNFIFYLPAAMPLELSFSFCACLLIYILSVIPLG